MFKNAKFFRFMPDQMGKGGVKTGYTSHRQINDTYDVLNFHVFVDRWRRDSASKAVSGVTNYTYSVRPLALHAYSSYSLSDPTAIAKTKILSHGINAGPLYRLQDHSANTAITYPTTHTGNAVAATFLNVKNRCFVGSGDGEGTILTMRDSSGVDVAANVAGFNYPIGVDPPSRVMDYYLTEISRTATVYMHASSDIINQPSTATPPTIDTLDAETIITLSDNFNGGPGGAWTTRFRFHGRPVSTDAQTLPESWSSPAFLQWNIGDTFVTLTAGFGAPGPTWGDVAVPYGENTLYYGLSLWYSNDLGVTWNSERIIDTAGAVCNLAGAVVNTSNVGDAPAYAWYIAGYQAQLQDFSNTGTLAGFPYAALTMTYVTGDGPLAWSDVGPQYGYAWYDPVTGHVSNLSPLTIVTAKDQLNQAVRLRVGTADISYPQPPDDTRFKYILLFRTLADGGSTLFVIGSLDPSSLDWFGISLVPLPARGQITCTTKSTYATGGITCIAKANIIDGETVLISDGTNPTTIFEFDTNGVVTPGNVQVDISTDTTAIEVAARLHAAINGVGAGLEVTSTDNLNGTLSLANDNLGADGDIAITDTVANAGFVVSGMSGGYDGILDTETLTLDDGANPASVFEFDTTGGGVAPGNVQVNISTDVTAVQVAARLTTAINGVGAGLGITATDNLDGTIALVNDSTGPAGNVPITDTVTDANFIVRGMINGCDYPDAHAVKIDDNEDSSLLVNGALRGPLFTNGKPKVSYWNNTTSVTETAKPAHMEYWDQRLWVTPTQDQATILYSCDPVQCTFGVAEESFPLTNSIRIPAADGAVTGMRLIGSLLVIFTKRFAYYIAGSNETNYRLMRFATHMPGVGRYQTCEVPGESEGQASLAFFGTDGRVGLYGVGAKIQYISDPIQKDIDAYLVIEPDYSKWRLHYASIRRRRYLLLSMNNNMIFTFDLDRAIWTRQQTVGAALTSLGAAAFASVYGGFSGATSGEPQEELIYTEFSQEIRAWLYDTTTGINGAFVKTFALDGGDPKKLKILDFVRLYVSQNSGGAGTPWKVFVFPNETQRVDIDCIENPDDVYNLYKPAGWVDPLDGANVKELIALPTDKFRNTTAFGVGANVAGPLVGYRFVVQVFAPANASAADLFAFDVCMSDYQDPMVTNP